MYVTSGSQPNLGNHLSHGLTPVSLGSLSHVPMMLAQPEATSTSQGNTGDDQFFTSTGRDQGWALSSQKSEVDLNVLLTPIGDNLGRWEILMDPLTA